MSNIAYETMAKVLETFLEDNLMSFRRQGGEPDDSCTVFVRLQRGTAKEWVKALRDGGRVQTVDNLVAKFLRWPLPESVCSDPCASMHGYPNRVGTNLLTATEAKQMIEYLFDGAFPAPDKEAIKKAAVEFFYWWHNQPGSNAAEGFDQWWASRATQAPVDITLEVEAAMTGFEKLAFLHAFTKLNPGWRGAKVADVLDTLDDSDSHLAIIEPLAEAHGHEITTPRLFRLAVLAVIYINGTEAATWENVKKFAERIEPEVPKG